MLDKKFTLHTFRCRQNIWFPPDEHYCKTVILAAQESIYRNRQKGGNLALAHVRRKL